MGQNIRALAIEERIFHKGGEDVRVGMRAGLGTRLGGGLPTLSQVSAQRAGGYLLHDADPSLL